MLHGFLWGRFPSVLVARSIPKNNPIVHGLIDGAHAAADMVEEMKKRKLEATCSKRRIACARDSHS